MPSKVSLLKDLAGMFWRWRGTYLRQAAHFARENLEIVKEPKEPLLLSNS